MTIATPPLFGPASDAWARAFVPWLGFQFAAVGDEANSNASTIIVPATVGLMAVAVWVRLLAVALPPCALIGASVSTPENAAISPAAPALVLPSRSKVYDAGSAPVAIR